MAKLTRANQKLFAQDAGVSDLGVFGSIADSGSLTQTTNPETMQSLTAFTDGWRTAVIQNGTKILPTMQDFNSLFYLVAYQLVYLFQAGIPEWDDATAYYTNSLCQVSGTVYISLSDTNLNQAPGSTIGTKWAILFNKQYQYFNNSDGTLGFRMYSSGAGGDLITERYNNGTSSWDEVARVGG